VHLCIILSHTAVGNSETAFLHLLVYLPQPISKSAADAATHNEAGYIEGVNGCLVSMQPMFDIYLPACGDDLARAWTTRGRAPMAAPIRAWLSHGTVGAPGPKDDRTTAARNGAPQRRSSRGTATSTRSHQPRK
jgi:hypothetical protein